MLAGEADSQLGDIGRMFARLTDAYAARWLRWVSRISRKGPSGPIWMSTATENTAPDQRCPDEYSAGERLVVAESDPARLGATKLQIGDLVGRHQHPAAFGSLQYQNSALGNSGPERGLDLVCFRVSLDNELTRRRLNPDLDFHSSPFAFRG